MHSLSEKPTVLVPKLLVECPPSVADHTLTLEEEWEQRRFGCDWIQKASILLGLKTEAMCNGQVIFHRFFYRRSMKEFDVKLVAMGALYLGCKLAETCRRVQDFVYIITFLEWLDVKEKSLTKSHRQTLTCTVHETSELLDSLETSCLGYFREQQQKLEFRQRRTNIHRIERHILRETGFRICEVLNHPHRSAIQYIYCLFAGVQEEWRHALIRYVWGYLNDALRLPLCCMFQPNVLITAAIYLGLQHSHVTLPHTHPWFELFDVSSEDMISVVTSLEQLYKSETPRYRVLADPPVPLPTHLVKSPTNPSTDDPAPVPEQRSSEAPPPPNLTTNPCE